MEKKKSDSSVRNAVATTVMSLVAGIVARALAKMSPDAVKKYLANPKDILGMKLPPELAATLGGGFAGLTVVEILKHLIPGLSGDILDYVQDFAVMVGERYDDVVEKGGTMTDQPSAPAQHFFQRKCLQSDAYPGVIFHLECGTRHHVTATVKEETDAKGKKRKVASTDPRSDFRTVSIEAVAALMNKNGRTPSTTDDGYDVYCTCDTLVAGELERYYAAEAAKKPKDPAQKDKKPGNSFLTFWGRAVLGKIEGVDLDKTPELRAIFDQLTKDDLSHLHEIDNDFEFVALCTAKNIAEFRKMVAVAKDRRFGSALSDLIGIPVEAVHHGMHAVKTAAGKVAAIVPGIPGKVGAYAAQLRVADIAQATAMRKAREKRQQERTARRAGKA
jgi:hypothetical protein